MENYAVFTLSKIELKVQERRLDWNAYPLVTIATKRWLKFQFYYHIPTTTPCMNNGK